MKHTPGPWALNADWFDDDLKNHVPVSSVHEHGGHLALAQVVWVMEDDRRIGRGSPECEANARLIAAAPDLLQWAVEYTSNAKAGESAADYAIRMDTAFNGLRAAIAKATGENA